MTSRHLLLIGLPLMILCAACQPALTRTPAPLSPTPRGTPLAGTPQGAAQTGAPSPELSLSRLPPAATETRAPAPRLFTEEFDANLPYWSFLQVDNGQPAASPSADAGFLVFDLPGPDQWAYAVYGGPDYADVRLDAQVQVRLGAEGALGLVCRYSEEAGWYEFNIYPDQTYMLLFGQWLAEGIARYTPLMRGESEKINSEANEIGLRCANDTLTPFINGVQMRMWREAKFGLRDGKIGISVASFEDTPFMAAYDWVKVSEP